MTATEIDERRRNFTLAKGHHYEGLSVTNDVAPDLPKYEEYGGDEVVFDDTPAETVRPDEARRVVEDTILDMVKWAHESPEKAALMAQIVRNNYPDEYRDKTNEEIIAELIQHAETVVTNAVKTVYQENNNWDKGNDLTAWKDGLWLPSPVS